MERIYYVDNNDQQTGESDEKLHAHHADTKLHAAFSCYIFNDKGQLLVTKRAETKKVWPDVWTNSCCGHPAPGESREDALKRRAQYELGLDLFSIQIVVAEYIYKTPPYKGVIEHEYCPIFIASTNTEPTPNPDEVSEYEWIYWKEYVKRTAEDSNDYTNEENLPIWSWWCKDQLSYLDKSTTFQDFLKSIS